jgi:hypothetical protein
VTKSAWAVLLLIGCGGVATRLAGRPGPEAGLLRGTLPSSAKGVRHPDRLTDGIAAMPGDSPRTELTSVFTSPDAYAIYDLGAETLISCGVIVADGDDRYTIALSTDGVAFSPLWQAEPIEDRGLQPRVTRELRGSGRYVRVSASGGDGLFAVAELAVAAFCPPRWPPVLGLPRGTPIADAVQTKAWTFAILAVAFILAYRRRAPDFIKLLVVLPAGFAIALIVQLVQIWPPPSSVLLTLAAACSLVVAALGLRLGWRRFFTKKPPESPESA